MSDSETKVFNPSVNNSPRMSPRENIKAEIVERPPSPETNCAICLEELRNKSYTNTCLHQFCFHCLLEWSKIKPECPLCKQSFSRIYHNIRANEDYDEHVLEPPMPPPSLDPHIFINVAFQRHRFRYRSTLGGSMMWAIQGLEPVPAANWLPNNYYIDYSVPAPSARPVRQGATTTRSVTRNNNRHDSLAFRRSVYRRGLWVRPGQASRFRECSPEFYRLNPAQTHRLVPWLTRELNVLLDMQYDTQTVCQDIVGLISSHHINSSVFNRAMTYYLGPRAEHFIHEFYHFAISPNDMNAYDSNAQYAQVGREFTSESDSDIEWLNFPDPLANLDFTTAAGPSGLQLPAAASPSQREPPASSNNRNYIIIELSDDDEETRNDEPDSDVEHIGSLPPRHLRTPEVITIESDSEIEVIPVSTTESPIDYIVVSSGDEIEEDQDEQVVNEIIDPTEDHQYISPCQPVYNQCPMFDNCPYSREVNRAAQNRRSSIKRERISSSSSSYSSSTTSSSSSSSNGTDIEEIDISSSSRATTSRGDSPTIARRRHKKKTSTNKRKSFKSSSTSSNRLKRKRSHESYRRVSNGGSIGNRRSSRDDSSVSTTEDTSTDDSINSNSIEKKRKGSRLKSIVLKVDRSSTTNSSKPSTSSNSNSSTSSHRYFRRRDSMSEMDE